MLMKFTKGGNFSENFAKLIIQFKTLDQGSQTQSDSRAA